MSKPLNQQITELTTYLAKLEADRDAQLDEMDKLGLLTFIQTKQEAETSLPYFRTLNTMNRDLDIGRQKLISIHLESINNYSNNLNQSMQTLNNSVNSLQNTTNKLV